MKIASAFRLFVLGLVVGTYACTAVGSAAQNPFACVALFNRPEPETPFRQIVSGHVKIAPHTLEIAKAVFDASLYMGSPMSAREASDWIDASILDANSNYYRTLTPGILLSHLPSTKQSHMIRERVISLHLLPRYIDEASQAIREAGLDLNKVLLDFGFSEIGRHYRIQKGNNDLVYVTGIVVAGFRKRGYDDAALREAMRNLEVGRGI